ncbi:MAG: hypothetical protein ACOCUL_02265 [Bacteroidota bacterium]
MIKTVILTVVISLVISIPGNSQGGKIIIPISDKNLVQEISKKIIRDKTIGIYENDFLFLDEGNPYKLFKQEDINHLAVYIHWDLKLGEGLILGVSPQKEINIYANTSYINMDDFIKMAGNELSQEFLETVKQKFSQRITSNDGILDYPVRSFNIYLASMVKPYDPKFLMEKYRDFILQKEIPCYSDFELKKPSTVNSVSYDKIIIETGDYTLETSLEQEIDTLLFFDGVILSATTQIDNYLWNFNNTPTLKLVNSKVGLLFSNDKIAWFNKKEFEESLDNFFETHQMTNGFKLYYEADFLNRLDFIITTW